MSGPPPPEAVERTLQWVTGHFRHFYANRPPTAAVLGDMTQREFGFLWNGRKFFLRHLGFAMEHDLRAFLLREGPHHAYYSTALYDAPGAPTMREKGWRGADLVFDLDADHLGPEAAAWPLEQQLAAIKREAKKLLDEFVLGDFAFAPEHVHVKFSGGRGYHILVTDPGVHAMDGAARRELVDYVCGKTLSPEVFVDDRAGSVALPRPDAPGWPGRYTRGVVAMVERLLATGTVEGVVREARAMNLKGVGTETARSLLQAVRPDATGSSQWGRFQETGRTAHPGLVKLLRMEALGVAGINEEVGESDEPVTADVKRLIRLPGSLHGKTGLVALPVPLERFDAFDPLRDAVAFGTAPVRMLVSKPEAVRLGGTAYTCDAGEQELPLRYAMFLALRRRALYAGTA